MACADGTAIFVGALPPTLFALLARAGLDLPRPQFSASVFALWVGLSQKVLLQSLLGLTRMWQLARTGHTTLAIVAAAIAVVWLMVLFVTLQRQNRLRMLAALYLAVSSVLVAFVGRPTVPEYVNFAQFPYRGERYYYLACCVFAFLVALTLDRCIRADRSAQRSMLLAGIFAVGITGNFRIASFADMHWQQYSSRIVAWKQQVQAGEEPAPLYVPINPPGWYLELPPRDTQ